MNIERIRELHAEMGALLGLPEADRATITPGIAIADRAALDAALAAATGGEVFALAPGDYGNLDWKPNFAKPVTIIGGSFGYLKLNRYHWKYRGKGAVLENVRATYLEVKVVDNTILRGCEAEQLLLESVDDVTVERCWLHDGQFPLRVLRATNFRILGNVLEGAREDTMRIYGDSHHGEVRGNVFLRNMAAKGFHGDHLQIYGITSEDMCPHDLVIEQNLLHDNPTGKAVTLLKDGQAGTGTKAGDAGQPAPAQGFFIGAAQSTMYRNLSIRRNLLRLGMKNGIFLSAGVENCPISENILVPVPGQSLVELVLNKDAKNQHWNNGGVTVSRNIVPKIMDEGKEAKILSDNHEYGSDATGLFAGITATTGGDRPEDYRLAKGSPIPATLVGWLEDTIAVTRATLDSVARG